LLLIIQFEDRFRAQKQAGIAKVKSRRGYSTLCGKRVSFAGTGAAERYQRGKPGLCGTVQTGYDSTHYETLSTLK
jgi:hypothetical protein